MEMEKSEKWMKIEFEKMKTFGTLEIDKKNVSLTRITEESRIMLQDTSLMDDERKKWFSNKKEEINKA